MVPIDPEKNDKTQLREAAGLTTNTLAKLGRNESVQLDVLGQICKALNCKLDDAVDFDGRKERYIPLPNIDLEMLFSSDEYERLGLKQLYDFPHPVNRKTVLDQLCRYILVGELSAFACNELLAELENNGVSLHIPDRIAPLASLIPLSFSQIERRSETEHIMVGNVLSWAITRKLSKESFSLSEICCDEEAMNTATIIERGRALPDHVSGGFYFSAFEQKNKIPCHAAYPMNLIADVLSFCGYYDYYVYEPLLPELSAAIAKAVETLTTLEQQIVKLFYQCGFSAKKILSTLDLPEYDTLLYIINNRFAEIPEIHRIIRKLRHPSRRKQYTDLLIWPACFAKITDYENILVHYVKKEKVLPLLEQNHVESLEAVRKTFLQNGSVSGDPEIISDLFLGLPIEYRIINGTKEKEVQWYFCPERAFADSVLDGELEGYNIWWGIETARKDNNSLGFLLCHAQNDSLMPYKLFTLLPANINKCESISQPLLENLYMLVSVYGHSSLPDMRYGYRTLIQFADEKEKIKRALKKCPMKGETTWSVPDNSGKDSLSFEDLGLSFWPENFLRRAGISTINEVLQLTEEDMQRICHRQKPCIDEIRNMLKMLSLQA